MISLTSIIKWCLPALLCLPIALHAQEVVFNEEFNDNSRNWWVGEDANISAQVSNGNYRLQWKVAGQFWYMTRSTFIDPTRDYVIEAVIRQVDGVDNNGYGIIWGRNGSSLNEFIVSSNGYVKVASYNEGWNDLQPWLQSTAIHPIGETNTLSLEKRGTEIHYSVNGTEVATTSAVTLYGQDIGIIVNEPMTIEADRLTVRQDQPPINIVPNMPTTIEKVNLGPNVNTIYSESGPIIAPDGKTLYFTGGFNPENAGGEKDADEIWISKALTDSTWGKRQRLGSPLNNSGPNWVISVTPDNNTLLLLNTYNSDGSSKGQGISMTHRTATGWSVPEDVNIKNLVNKSGWYQFCLSSDRKVMLMGAVGEETYGLHDLYVSFLQSDGTWSEQKNLGSTLNTFGEDETPFLAADGVTLFFSSTGHHGYGGYDLYITRRLDDSWTQWSEPQNLGPAINTIGDERFFTTSASGNYAYVASTQNSLGSADIFRMRLPEAIRPQPVVLVYGTVLNSKTKKPIGAEITYRDLASDREVGAASSSPADGSYKIVLPAGKLYSFMADQKGYYAVSDNLDVKALKEYREIKRDLYLTPIEVGATIRLNNLFFDFAKTELREESYPELNRAVQFLHDNPSVVIEVAGHTDNVGSDAANKKLSEDRAHSVMTYLTTKGIDASRIASKGYGESKPVATNNTDEGRQMNRRVEFTIVRQ